MICLIDRISVYCKLSNSLFVTSICFMFWFIFCFSVSCLCHLLSPFWGELGLRFASYVSGLSGVMINLGICLAASDSILVVVLGTCHFGVFQNSFFFSSLIWVFFLFGVRPWMQISRILPVVVLLCLLVSYFGTVVTIWYTLKHLWECLSRWSRSLVGYFWSAHGVFCLMGYFVIMIWQIVCTRNRFLLGLNFLNYRVYLGFLALVKVRRKD